MPLISKDKKTNLGRDGLPTTEFEPKREDDPMLLGEDLEIIPLDSSTLVAKKLKKSGGRRTSDLFKPILEKVFSVVAAENINEGFLNLTDEIRDFLGCEMLVIYSVDRAANQIFSRNLISEKIEEKRLNISKKSLAGYVAETGAEVIVADVSNSGELKKYPGLKHDVSWDKKLKIKTKSAMVVPISHNGRLMGVLEIVNNIDESSFNHQFFELVQELAQTLGNALSKLESEENEENLRSIGLTLQKASITEETFFETIQPILKLFDADMMALYAIDEDKNEIYSKVNSGESSTVRILPVSADSIAGWVAMDKRVVNIEDVYEKEGLQRYHPELRFNDNWDVGVGKKTKAMLCCPLVHEERLVGVLQVFNHNNPRIFDPSDERNIIALAEMLSISIYNSKVFAKVKPHKYSYLINNGIITEDELKSALSIGRKTGVDSETILNDEFNLKKEDIGKSLELFYEIPFHAYDPSVVLPKRYFMGLNIKFLKKNHWVPIQNDEKLVVILVDDPMDNDKIRGIKMIFPKKEIQFRIGLRSDIINFLESSLTDEVIDEPPLPVDDENVSALLESIKSDKDYGGLMEFEDEEEESAISESDNSIVRLVNKIIIDAYLQGVSDIHIEPGSGKQPLMVRFRKEGECELFEKIPPIYKYAMVSRIKIMAKLDIAERRLPQDGKIKLKYGRKDIELRVATCPTVGKNEDVVMRILAANEAMPLEKMAFSPENEEIVKRSVVKPYGLILCVGPTGSGKTTTLHACLGHINTPKKKIWTAEDPVEITQMGLRQVQVHSKIGFDFARAMRSFLRGDPDVIMVGEMRDEETCSIALEASLTGHLVFSTLHTNSAPETITRLIDMGMSPFNFADALIMILAQRLVKTLCKKCKEDYHPTKEEFEALVEEYGEEYFQRLNIEYNDDLILKKPKGCQLCKRSGYAGRVSLHEVLEATKIIKRMIMKKCDMEEIREQAIKDGMTTLKQDGIFKIFQGLCDFKQVAAVTII